MCTKCDLIFLFTHTFDAFASAIHWLVAWTLILRIHDFFFFFHTTHVPPTMQRNKETAEETKRNERKKPFRIYIELNKWRKKETTIPPSSSSSTEKKNFHFLPYMTMRRRWYYNKQFLYKNAYNVVCRTCINCVCHALLDVRVRFIFADTRDPRSHTRTPFHAQSHSSVPKMKFLWSPASSNVRPTVDPTVDSLIKMHLSHDAIATAGSFDNRESDSPCICSMLACPQTGHSKKLVEFKYSIWKREKSQLMKESK